MDHMQINCTLLQTDNHANTQLNSTQPDITDAGVNLPLSFYWQDVLGNPRKYLLQLHPFNGLFPRTKWVSWHQKGKLFWILMKQETMGWQCHQLDHMQIICTLLQTDNHVNTPPLSF